MECNHEFTYSDKYQTFYCKKCKVTSIAIPSNLSTDANNCQHEYEVLHDGIEVEETRFMGDSEVKIELSGYVIFHCKRCLDIQKKVL